MPDLNDLLAAEAQRQTPSSTPGFATIESRIRLRRRRRLTSAAAVLAIAGSGAWVAATRQVSTVTLSVVAQNPTPTGAPMYDGHLTGEQAVEVFDGRTLEEAVRRAHALGIAVFAYDARESKPLQQDPHPVLSLLIDRGEVAWVSGTRDQALPSPPVSEAEAEALVGLPARDALRRIVDNSWLNRVHKVNGVDLAVTSDLRLNRIDLALADGIVRTVTRG